MSLIILISVVILLLVLSLVAAYLGALGGQHNITIRRLGVPGVITLGSLLLRFSPWCILLMGMFGGMSIGYGLPSFNGPNGTMDDEGSALGKLVWRIIPNMYWANVIVRGIVGLVTMIPVVIYAIIGGHLLRGLESVIVVRCCDAFFSWEGYGSVRLFGKDLIVSDLIYYGVVAAASFYAIAK